MLTMSSDYLGKRIVCIVSTYPGTRARLRQRARAGVRALGMEPSCSMLTMSSMHVRDKKLREREKLFTAWLPRICGYGPCHAP